MPTSCDDSKSKTYYSLEFISRFLPQSKQDIDASFNDEDFTRKRKLPLAITLALLINMVRPGKRFGYQEVIKRFFSDTGLAHEKGLSPRIELNDSPIQGSGIHKTLDRADKGIR